MPRWSQSARCAVARVVLLGDEQDATSDAVSVLLRFRRGHAEERWRGAGVPAANAAFAVAQRVLANDEDAVTAELR